MSTLTVSKPGKKRVLSHATKKREKSQYWREHIALTVAMESAKKQFLDELVVIKLEDTESAVSFSAIIDCGSIVIK